MEIHDDENSNLAYLCFTRNILPPPKSDYEWYVLDTQKLTLEKHKEMSDCKFLFDFGCAVLNSNVYVVGGKRQSKHPNGILVPDNQVQFFDTTSTSKKWQLGVPMNRARSSSHVIALNNKLYVFGGDRGVAPSPSTWAEYFDGDQWILIENSPPQFVNIPTLFGSAVYGGGHSILLWNQSWFCIFDVSTNQWNKVVMAPDPFAIRFQPEPELEIYSTKVAVINDTMFWFFGNFFAYDLNQNKTFEEPVYSLPKIKPPFDKCKRDFLSPMLFTTGRDQLCLVWYERPPFDYSVLSEDTDVVNKYIDNYSLQVYRMTFQVERLPSQSSDPNIVLRPIQEPIVSTIKACYLQTFAGIYWQNHGKGIRDCDGANPPQISSSSTLLDHLAHSMYHLNYWQLELEEEGNSSTNLTV